VNREELAKAIRRARDRVRPDDVGLPVGRQRRVAGLRREELALLAGISVDYVVRLEQGRGPLPSEQVLSSLARALRLEKDERDHLFHLAGWAPPRRGTIDMHVRPSVLRLIDRFADLPTMVLSAKSHVLAWNAMSSALHGDWSALRPERRNQLRLRFLPDSTEPQRTVVGGSAENRVLTATQAVANLRSAAGRYAATPRRAPPDGRRRHVGLRHAARTRRGSDPRGVFRGSRYVGRRNPGAAAGRGNPDPRLGRETTR
jgi:transcriptional regulator with XRE-family HTH domain